MLPFQPELFPSLGNCITLKSMVFLSLIHGMIELFWINLSTQVETNVWYKWHLM